MQAEYQESLNKKFFNLCLCFEQKNAILMLLH